MSHDFSHVPKANIPRSQFKRSHGHKTTMDAGYLVPFYVDEVIPGDSHKMNLTSFIRLATPITPIMDNIQVDFHFWFVPNRLVDDNWQKMMGEQENPGDSTDYLTPQCRIYPPGMAATGIAPMTLADYFGITTTVGGTAGLSVSALPFRSYVLIFNNWYRDENLQNSIPVAKDDGPDDLADFPLLIRGKRFDYFTSALPWPQKGPSVQIPSASSALVSRLANAPGAKAYRSSTNTLNSSMTGLYTDVAGNIILDGPTDYGFSLDPNGGLYTDTSDLMGTINELRQAVQVQKLYERDARGGTRYTEILRSHFGVISPDARLQRPEYLGGGTSFVNINPVSQTSSTDATTPQGNLAAFGTSSQSGIGFSKSFVEHGFIIGIMSARADLNYQQGIDRFWFRETRFDYYWPVFAHLGEMAILNREIYTQSSAADTAVFGYQEFAADYRYKNSRISGLFRSNVSGSLDIWHLAQDFAGLPTLSPSFIVENPPIDRVIAVPTQPHFLVDLYMDLISARPMPTYSVPGLMDHF